MDGTWEALRRIELVEENEEQSLNLSSLKLDDETIGFLSDRISQLARLTSLNLSDNKLTTLPDSFANLPQLTSLYLGGNQLTKLPNCVINLSQLSLLALGSSRLSLQLNHPHRFIDKAYPEFDGNKLKTLPDDFRRLTKLRVLDLDDNQLTKLPDCIGQLTQLRELYLGNNQLTTLPNSIDQLTQLKSLYLSSNLLQSLPNGTAKLTKLASLYLRANKFTKIPDSVFELTQLTLLDLRGIGLKVLPGNFSVFTDLTWLDIGGNKFTTLPDCIFQLTQLTFLRLCYNNLTSLSDKVGQLTQLTFLDLSGNDFNKLPSSIGFLTRLRGLYLSGNRLKVLPDSIANLIQLTSLRLSSNQIPVLPTSINQLSQLTCLNIGGNFRMTGLESLSQLTHLRVLSLYGMQFTTIPDSIFQLTQLEELDLGANMLESVPDSIGQLMQLTSLSLSGNRLATLPGCIDQLTQLTLLNFSQNPLKLLPNRIGQLSELVSLELESTELSALPDSISQLSKLTSLDLWRSRLTSLPKDFGQLTQLTSFKIFENPLVEPPLEIAERGIDAIRDYFEQIEQQDVDYLYEAKLIIVGDPGAGKTTLLNKLIDPDYPVPNEPKSTIGINVRQWRFAATVNREKIQHSIEFRCNLWDFGGQKIQYMVHQFFLSSRALYVLVSDDRAQRTNFDYWINLIEVLGNKSPILVLLNEKNHQSLTNFNPIYYEKHYPGMIKEVRDIDFASEDGRYQTLTTHLKTHLTSLDHVGNPLPKQWISIRNALEKLQVEHAYITFKEYKIICEQHRITEEHQQLTLSQYLHDIGTIVHFQKETGISHWIILDPNWVVGAVYSILTDKTVHQQQGRFGKDWLFDRWHQYAMDEQDFLLSLMLKNRFDICYATDASNEHYIVPQLLPVQTPTFTFNRSNNLLFRYQYTFMPYGLLPRLIMRLSAEIEQQQGQAMNWQSGLITNDGDTAALIEEDTSDQGLKTIDIRVSGNSLGRKEYLSHIRKSIESIHKESYKNIVYDAMIPCNNCLKLGFESPNYLPYKQLSKFVAKGIQENTCGVCLEKYSPAELIYGVFTENELSNKNEENRNNSGVGREIHMHVNGNLNFKNVAQLYTSPVDTQNNFIDMAEKL